PPSTVLAVYGIITEQDIGKLFIAGIVPGLLAAAMYMATITIIGLARPGFLPEGPRASPHERLAAVQDIWAPLLLFVFVVGGLYGLPFLPRFTPTERAASAPPARSCLACCAAACGATKSCARCCRRPARPPPCSRC